MSVRVIHSLDDLADDLETIARRAPADMRRVVAEHLREGKTLARTFAKESAGAHGKHYHRAFSTEMTGLTVGEYGPDASKPQGGMSFERGSRNQKPHLDLARSADVVGPKFGAAVHGLPDEWFWPK